MSTENVALVKQAFEAFARQDIEAWLAMVDDGIRLFPRKEEPGVKACYEGKDEMFEYLGNWFSGWAEYTVHAEEFIDAGDYVVVNVREIGIAEASGIRVEAMFAHAFKVQGGRSVEWRMFGPVEEALRAIGETGSIR